MRETSLSSTILLVVGLILLVPFLMLVLMFPLMGMWGGGHMWSETAWSTAGPGMLLGMWLASLATLALVGYLIYRGTRSGTDRTDPAIDELRNAYARGDLTDEQFENRLERLRDDGSP